jgi:light-regulated signal transduction histidine kinase (bacteriophytochrome)
MIRQGFPGRGVEWNSWMFEPFRRLQDRTSGDGFGLGLAIVASIATMHGGTVAAHPMPAGGLRITVTMPATAVGRGSLAGKLVLAEDWDSSEVNEAIAGDFGLTR